MSRSPLTSTWYRSGSSWRGEFETKLVDPEDDPQPEPEPRRIRQLAR
jgi:hypothetical protein